MKCMSIWSVNLHGVWRHSTLCNIHMDTNMDMDTEYIISHMECGDLVYYISSHLKILMKSLNFEI